MSRTSIAVKALARSYRAERILTFLVGLVALLAGVAALLVGYRVFGEFRAQRSVLDPIAVDWLGREPVIAKAVAIAVGVVLLTLGLWWFFRSLRTEGRPHIKLDRSPEHEVTVTAGAIARAVQQDVEGVAGISKARVRAVGDVDHPALRLSLWLQEGADIKQVWQDLDQQVLTRARQSLGVTTLPTAVRMELDAGQRQRVR